jgi:hypothetical protein
LVELKKIPSFPKSPPSAYNLFVPASKARPKSARCGVNVGPAVHTPGAELISRREVVVRLTALGSKPPTTYRN